MSRRRMNDCILIFVTGRVVVLLLLLLLAAAAVVVVGQLCFY